MTDPATTTSQHARSTFLENEEKNYGSNAELAISIALIVLLLIVFLVINPFRDVDGVGSGLKVDVTAPTRQQ